MKKIFTSCLIFSLLAGFVFAEAGAFFKNRILEVKLDVPVDISNNAISFEDVLVPAIEIDLREFCDNLPRNGFSFATSINPQVAINLKFPKGLIFCLGAGIDVYSNISMSKDLFKFIAYGNKIGDEVSVDIDAYADSFGYAQANLGWNTGKVSTYIQPAIFGTLAHVVSHNSYAKFQNTADGQFNVDVNALFNIYSEFTKDDFTNNSFTDINVVINKLMPTMGFDLGGYTSFKLGDFITINAYGRIPIIPSRVSKVTPYSYNNDFSVSLDTFVKSGSDSENEENTDAGEQPEDAEKPNYAGKTDMGETIAADYRINRPLKVSVGAEFYPFGNFISYFGSLGVGVVHPFAQNKAELNAYLDYLLGVKLSLLNIISFSVSTERTDEIFKHKAMLSLSVRIVQIDAGVAFESTSLANSFKGDGIGAFVTAYVGL